MPLRPRAHPHLLVGLLLLTSYAAAAPAAPATEVDDALRYVASQQQANGRWALPSQGYVTEAAAAAGLDPKRWPSQDASAFAALTPEACTQPAVPEHQQPCYLTIQRIVHAAGAAGYDPRAMNGFDGVERVRAGFVGGQFGTPRFVNDDVWGILALRAAGVPTDDPMIRAAVDNVRRARAPDGGWSDVMVATRGDTDMTGMALSALAAAGEDVRGDVRARDFLLAHWHADGSFSNGPIGPNPQSTAWAIHGLHNLGLETNASALDFLRSRQSSDGSVGSGLWPTTEALVPLAGARFPLPSFTPTATPAPRGHALEPVRFEVTGPFTNATWTLEGATLRGRSATHTFAAPGTYAFHVVAEGPGARWRGEGNVTVLSARPTLPAFPATVTVHRHVNVTLDTRNATDPDGRVVAARVDWGDGNETNTTTHAYARPGEHTVRVRVQDDAGAWSDPATILVRVLNRAPVLPALPATMVVDRVDGVALPLDVSDPEGDAVTLRWSFGERKGEGAPRFVPTTLGSAMLHVHATDAYGGETKADVRVEVVNLPPRVELALPAQARADEPLELRATAVDADGPMPTLAWTVDGSPTEARVTLAEGEHEIVVVATDADGANATARATLRVGARPDAPAPLAFNDMRASLEDGMLTVWFNTTPPDAEARIDLASDVGDATYHARSPFLLPLDAAWATATLTLSQGDASATRETGLLLAPARTRAAAAEPPAETVVVRGEPTPAPAPQAPEGDARAPAQPLEGSSRAPTPEGHAARQETPWPAAWAVAALALATLGTRGRKA